jgi:hypothetical protein
MLGRIELHDGLLTSARDVTCSRPPIIDNSVVKISSLE